MARYARQLLACAALTLAAGAVAAQELPTFRLEMKNGHFDPTEVVVPANTRFKLVLHNAGTDAEEFESLELKKEKVLAPGATSFVVFAPLKPGSYRFFGEFHPDTAQGRIVSR
ncbi:cupredoxin domain-containing protein [Simplicispira psychrophila]|uniref:cupredoxin domain-containing protein n=1 Tax=Simplicispira psychrophila TaxID=80882 RepID=UPI00056D6927|nr:cupredoxin domain-containing protein [Simplicispira psychrophila]